MCQKIIVDISRVRELNALGWSDPMIAKRLKTSADTIRRNRTAAGIGPTSISHETVRARLSEAARRRARRHRQYGIVRKKVMARRMEGTRRGWPGFTPEEATILDSLRANGGQTLKQLVGSTGLSYNTVKHFVPKIAGANAVENKGSRVTGGRKKRYVVELTRKGHKMWSFYCERSRSSYNRYRREREANHRTHSATPPDRCIA